MRNALIGLTAVLVIAGGLQAQAATDWTAPSASTPAAQRTVQPADDSERYMAMRNAQVQQAWGQEPFGYGVQKAYVEDRIVFGNPRPEAKPLASTLADFRHDISLSNEERARYSIISTAP